MLKLVKMSKEYTKELFEMMDEWTSANEKIIPWSIRRCDYRDIDNYMKNLEVKDAFGEYVEDSTYFLLDTDQNKFLGAVNIRHSLNEKLLKSGGHIGDGIRPSQRNKGYGTKIIALALEKCKALGIEKVLMTCDKTNVASARTIIKNGGKLENEVLCDEVIVQRYWIDNTK